MTLLYRQKLQEILELLIKATRTRSSTKKANYTLKAKKELETLKQIKQ